MGLFREKKEELHELIARREYKKAIQIVRKRLFTDPENSGMHLQLAELLLSNAQIREAIRQYRRVAEQYLREGNIVKSIALYKKMLQIKPSKDIESQLENLSERMAIAEAVKAPEPPSTGKKKQGRTKKKERPATLALESQTKLFKDLNPEEFKQIVAKLSLRHLDEETIVVKEGDEGVSMFIIVQGEVRVLTKNKDGKKVVLSNLGEGEFFGEVSLLTGRPRTATIITNTGTDILELTRADYEYIISRYPRVKQVMEDFHVQRAYRTVEAMIASLRKQG